MSPAGEDPRRIALVVNPSAGKGRAQALLPQVAGRLRDAGHSVTLALSRNFDEARDQVAEAAAQEPDTLAVMGGDGMLHLGVNAVADRLEADGISGPSDVGRRPVLGLIPAGTGNDLCRGVGLDPADPGAAVEAIASGRIRPLDLARVADRWIGTVVATGFDALVNRRANAMARPKGSSRYTLAALAELRTFRPLTYRLTVDGETRHLSAMLVAVGNTSSYGGGMRICPAADPFDGWLDLTIIHPVSRAKLLQLLPQMRSGRFAADPCVEQLRARTVTVEGPGLIGYGDGEAMGSTPLTVESRPGAVDICGTA